MPLTSNQLRNMRSAPRSTSGRRLGPVYRPLFGRTEDMEDLYVDEQGRIWELIADYRVFRPGTLGFNDGGAFIQRPDGSLKNVYVGSPIQHLL